MFYCDVLDKAPISWSPMSSSERCLQVPLSPNSAEFTNVKELLFKGQYVQSYHAIYRVQNPLLWAKYLIKMSEYEKRGSFQVKPLYHDTSISNVQSIVEYNFDWRLGQRTKYGQGVYFSVEPDTAFRHSSKDGSYLRAMFVVDVLVQKVQIGEPNMCLPSIGYDTILAHHSKTYVKFFDTEYYPKYVMVYEPNYYNY